MATRLAPRRRAGDRPAVRLDHQAPVSPRWLIGQASVAEMPQKGPSRPQDARDDNTGPARMRMRGNMHQRASERHTF
jgi:hypothetical protein